MKVASASLFVAILVNPLPGGGKIPAIGQAETVHLEQTLVLGLVLLATLIQVAALIHAAGLLKRLAVRICRRFGRKPQRKLKIPRATGSGQRYLWIAVLPLLPFGGGMLWAIGLCHAWQLDRRASWLLIALSNTVSFGYLYLLAGSFGLLTFGLVLAALAAGWWLAKWLKPWTYFPGFRHA